jgi:hypothetical protein
MKQPVESRFSAILAADGARRSKGTIGSESSCVQYFYSSISLAEAAGNSWLSTGQMRIAAASQPSGRISSFFWLTPFIASVYHKLAPPPISGDSIINFERARRLFDGET